MEQKAKMVISFVWEDCRTWLGDPKEPIESKVGDYPVLGDSFTDKNPWLSHFRMHIHRIRQAGKCS